MKKFSDIIQKSGEPDKNAPSGVIKGRVAITKSDDDKMLAFGWANVSLTVNGETIEDYQGDIIEPGNWKTLHTILWSYTERAAKCTKEAVRQS